MAGARFRNSSAQVLSLPLPRRYFEAVELVSDLDLARQPRIRPHIKTEIQHVLFHRRPRPHLFAPVFLDIDMARRAGAPPATFCFEALVDVADIRFLPA